MQITSLHLDNSASGIKNDSTTGNPTSSKPEDFLTILDTKMLEYLTGTDSLADAEANPHGLQLAQTLGKQRESGSVTGDVSSNYMANNLTESDAKMVEHLTGTTNLIDAQNAGNQSVDELIMNVGIDRKYGFVSGDLSPTYMNGLISFDEEQTKYQGGLGISVSLDIAKQALAYLQSELKTDTTQQAASSYSAKA